MNNSLLSKIRWPRPFAGLRGITRADVPREAMAGVTLAALMIPLNIGYAQVATGCTESWPSQPTQKRKLKTARPRITEY